MCDLKAKKRKENKDESDKEESEDEGQDEEENDKEESQEDEENEDGKDEDEESIEKMEKMCISSPKKLIFNIFACEVPALLNLDKMFLSRQQACQHIQNRPKVQTDVGILVRMYDVDQADQKYTRMLTDHCQISGRICFETFNPCVILLKRQRKTDHIYRRVFPNDECLAQVYMWLIDRPCRVKYIETSTEAGGQRFTAYISKSSQFETVVLQSLRIVMTEHIK